MSFENKLALLKMKVRKTAQDMPGGNLAPGGAVNMDAGMGMPPSTQTGQDSMANASMVDPASEPPIDETMGEDVPEEGMDEEGKLEKATKWIVKYHNGNYWIGRVFPEKFIEDASKFMSQRTGVPKEQVREYLEKLKDEGETQTGEEMPEPEADAMPEGEAVPGAEAAGAGAGTPPQPQAQEQVDQFMGGAM